MSALFMCDNCGEVFSVNQGNFRTFTEDWDGNPATKDAFHNAYNHGAKSRHIGPCCNGSDATFLKPRLALPPIPEDRKA